MAELLRERTELLVQFCRLAGTSEVTPEQARLKLLRSFCQLLVDYVALWQFELQPMLLDVGEESAAELGRWQPVMEQSSQTALAFNDRYDDKAHPIELFDLDVHLSRLGEVLAERFDAEDRVLAGI